MNWFKNYKTKSEELNKRQNEFISIYKDFKLTLSGDKDRANREVGKIIVYLVNYVSTYFALEEEYLKKIDFQEYENHKSHHKEFTIKVFEVLNLLKKKQVYRPIQLHYLLDSWFHEHIEVQDVKYLIESGDD